MKVAELLERRRQNWRELEQLCEDVSHRNLARGSGIPVARFAALYRAACADLALADAYQLPPGTVQYLHQLVGRAHNQLYRSRRFNFHDWGREMFHRVPRRLLHDNCLRLAFFLFYGVFLLSMYLASAWSPVPDFAEQIVSKEGLAGMEAMYAERTTRTDADNLLMAGFYLQHNTSIGLVVFASGLLFGIGGLFATVFNAAMLGSVFGHMTKLPQWQNFYEFVTAHGPFELTAIVLAAAAGMRLGFALIDTNGHSRSVSVRNAGLEAMPTMGASIILFFLAALIEGFISPSELPYSVKSMIAVLSAGSIMFYIVLLGLRNDEPAEEAPRPVHPLE